jgi:cystathionine gamma-synthase
MSTRDLLHKPIWQADELGMPIPPSPHAVSMALPRWQDVVGYEEHRPETVAKLTSGYPRFLIHPLVQALARRISQGAHCLPFPSERTAMLCGEYITRATGERYRLAKQGGVYGVVTTEAGAQALKDFWQHTGMIVSSRQAEAELKGQGEIPDAKAIRHSLRQQLAALYDCAADDVFLTPSGMAAHFAALQAVGDRRPGLPTAQLGFPYVDTFKLQKKVGVGSILLHELANLETGLEELVRQQPLAACYCEIPGNPLLGSADVRRARPILRKYGIPLVVDDVVATPFNIDLSAYADLIATSLTKFIVGTGDAMGGALICNPRSPYYAELKKWVQSRHEELLWGAEAAVIEAQAHGFCERMRRHNRNGLAIAERLRRHDAVERVWYPKWEFADVYEAVRRPEGGWGALVTFLPKNAETRTEKIFDALPICKGPSLGTVYTLACPFTVLAHYSELKWAEACGVSRYLIRISLGLEDPEELWRRIEPALRAS